jgi:thymidylate synthase ThyX
MSINTDPNIKAKVVYDTILQIPEEMGIPSPEQMNGTRLEQTGELCCRICYDSLGKGRSSDAMHDHLLEVKHWSVYEHGHFTLELRRGLSVHDALALANRPGLTVRQDKYGSVRITLNARHLLDWDRWTKLSYPNYETQASANRLFDEMLCCVKKLGFAPRIFKNLKPYGDADDAFVAPVQPNVNSERKLTLFLSGSRGMSHEQVRHRFNISQRSTRYVDEDSSPWVEHPLMGAYFAANPDSPLKGQISGAINASRETYVGAVSALQTWLISQKVDKFTARKQARGAARGFLGNALCTELMFTASVDMWLDMLGLRAAQAADAEIRVLYGCVLNALKSSAYGKEFEHVKMVPAPDGLGEVLA